MAAFSRVSPRRAFTLVELLVVIAIIGTLMAIILPAVQAARESGRRTQCANNLKQMGIALHDYHSAHKAFPRGGCPPTAAEINKPRLSWGAAILPGLDQTPLYESIDKNLPYWHATNLTAGKTALPVFLCPTSSKATLLKNCSPPYPANQYARSDYGGISGEQSLRAPTATNSPERGVLILERPISQAEIRDGTSCTLMVAEAPEGQHSMWFHLKNLFEQSKPINTKAQFAPAYVFYDYGQEISSYHSGGAYTLFADGSVHFLSETMSDKVLAALCSRAGAEPVSEGTF